MKRKTLYFLVILILALFTVNSIVKINSYALIRSQKTDKGVKFNNNGKIEYLDVGMDKIKTEFIETPGIVVNNFFRVTNLSKYPIYIFGIKLKNKDNKENFDMRTYSIASMENKIDFAYIEFDKYIVEQYEYIIFKDDLFYTIKYDVKTGIYETYIQKLDEHRNEFIRADENGLQFYLNEKKENLDLSINDFEFHIENLYQERDFNYKAFMYKNNSKYTILNMELILYKKENKNKKERKYIIIQETPVLPKETSPIKILDFDEKEYGIENILFSVLKDMKEYDIDYDCKLDIYEIDKSKYESIRSISNNENKIGYKVGEYSNDKHIGEETISFSLDDIEFIGELKNKKYTINRNTRIKNNSNYTIRPIFNVIRTQDNAFMGEIYPYKVDLESGDESFLMEVGNDTYTEYEQIKKKSDLTEYKLSSMVFLIKLDKFQYAIIYYPKLNIYKFKKAHNLENF